MHRSPLVAADVFASAYSRPVTREGLESPPAHDPPPPPLHSPPSITSSNSAPHLAQSHSANSIATVTESSSSSSLSNSNANANANQQQQQQSTPRRPVFGRKPASFTGSRRRSSSGAPSIVATNAVVTDTAAPPALPDYALSAAAKIAARDPDAVLPSPSIGPEGGHPGRSMLARSGTSTTLNMMPPPPTSVGGGSSANGTSFWQPTDASVVHQQITDLANKRIATLDYLRRAHGGRVYWFNAYLIDRSDIGRMPSFDSRRLARKATNYLLLGLSLPVIIDLYSTTPLEFLRCLGSLLSEFDSFQQLRNDSSSAALARARIPNMFRRPGGKTRRSTSAADTAEEAAAAAASVGPLDGGAGISGMSPGSSAPSFMNFAAGESDLVPGEEYTYLLTPSLPFDPDYFETFETLCDTLIDCYARFLALVPTPRECSASVAELFTKADVRVRKIIVQGVVKEFEDCSRANVRSEIANVGKVVLGGLV